MTALRFASFDDEFLEPTLSILKIIDKHGKFHEQSAIFQQAPPPFLSSTKWLKALSPDSTQICKAQVPCHFKDSVEKT
jgi:hypothetical protein